MTPLDPVVPARALKRIYFIGKFYTKFEWIVTRNKMFELCKFSTWLPLLKGYEIKWNRLEILPIEFFKWIFLIFHSQVKNCMPFGRIFATLKIIVKTVQLIVLIRVNFLLGMQLKLF